MIEDGLVLGFGDALAVDKWVESGSRWWACFLAESVVEAGASLLVECVFFKVVEGVGVESVALLLGIVVRDSIVMGIMVVIVVVGAATVVVAVTMVAVTRFGLWIRKAVITKAVLED